MKETIEVESCKNYEVFHLVLTYMYTGKISLDKHNVDDILDISHNFAISKLKNYAVEYLEKMLRANNCLKIIELSTKYHLSDLSKQTMAFINKNFKYIVQYHDIEKMSLTVFQEFLNKAWYFPDELILRFITCWVSQEKSGREENFVNLLHNVTWSSLDPAFISSHLDNEEFFYSSPESLLTVLKLLDINNIVVNHKFTQVYHDLQDREVERERLYPDHDLEQELDDNNSFLSIAINSAVKDLEHQEVDETFSSYILQPETYAPYRHPSGQDHGGSQPSGSELLPYMSPTNLVKPGPLDKSKLSIDPKVDLEKDIAVSENQYNLANDPYREEVPQFRGIQEARYPSGPVGCNNFQSNFPAGQDFKEIGPEEYQTNVAPEQEFRTTVASGQDYVGEEEFRASGSAEQQYRGVVTTEPEYIIPTSTVQEYRTAITTTEAEYRSVEMETEYRNIVTTESGYISSTSTKEQKGSDTQYVTSSIETGYRNSGEIIESQTVQNQLITENKEKDMEEPSASNLDITEQSEEQKYERIQRDGEVFEEQGYSQTNGEQVYKIHSIESKQMPSLQISQDHQKPTTQLKKEHQVPAQEKESETSPPVSAQPCREPSPTTEPIARPSEPEPKPEYRVSTPVSEPGVPPTQEYRSDFTITPGAQYQAMDYGGVEEQYRPPSCGQPLTVPALTSKQELQLGVPLEGAQYRVSPNQYPGPHQLEEFPLVPVDQYRGPGPGCQQDYMVASPLAQSKLLQPRETPVSEQGSARNSPLAGGGHVASPAPAGQYREQCGAMLQDYVVYRAEGGYPGDRAAMYRGQETGYRDEGRAPLYDGTLYRACYQGPEQYRGCGQYSEAYRLEERGDYHYREEARGHRMDRLPSRTDFDFSTEYQILEQVINEHQMSEAASGKYSERMSTTKRYDPKHRALAEAFRQMEEAEMADQATPVPSYAMEAQCGAAARPQEQYGAFRGVTLPREAGSDCQYARGCETRLALATPVPDPEFSMDRSSDERKETKPAKLPALSPGSPPASLLHLASCAQEPLQTPEKTELPPAPTLLTQARTSLSSSKTEAQQLFLTPKEKYAKGVSALSDSAKQTAVMDLNQELDIPKENESPDKGTEETIPEAKKPKMTIAHIMRAKKKMASQKKLILEHGEVRLTSRQKLRIRPVRKKVTRKLRAKDVFHRTESPARSEEATEAEAATVEAEKLPSAPVKKRIVNRKDKLLAEHRSQSQQEEPGLEGGDLRLKPQPKRTFTCPICSSQTSICKDHFHHIKVSQHLKETNNIKQCHQEQHIPGPPYPCPNCQYTSSKLQQTVAHLSCHSDRLVKQNKNKNKVQICLFYRPQFGCRCPGCDFRADSALALRKHQKTHNQPQFSCQTCGKSFSHKYTLEQHQAVHTEEKKFKCKLCSFR